MTPEQIAQIVAATIAAMNKPKASAKASKKPAVAPSTDGKGDRQLKTERAVVTAFKKAGYGNVTPRVDVKTYNLWLKEGFKVKEGEKSIKVKQFRLFHRKQVEFIGHPAKPEAMTEAQILEFQARQATELQEPVSS